ncbi:trypsin-like serine protease [Nocardia xishanensis]|uniref:trypsin-like serine protease n=1 Tax=Nocardia xishanensis TaxID=238964 RepID=UPI00082AA267|nr:trypsin-like serine protease [Nocardia xishanensis]
MNYRNKLTQLLLATALVTGLGAMFPAAANAQGVAYPGMTITTGESICSVGATGHMGEAKYAVTAAHCFQEGRRVYDENGRLIGWYEQSHGDDATIGGIGFALIRLAAGVGVSASLGNFGIESTYTDARVGQEVCHVGWATNWTCGRVSEVGDTFFVADFAADKGDSGGIVYFPTPQGRAAFLGIVIGTLESGGVLVESANYLRDAIDAHAQGPDHFRWYVE